jgi:hypothetical protein
MMVTIPHIDNLNTLREYRGSLHNKSGIYGIINLVTGELYVGSSNDL